MHLVSCIFIGAIQIPYIYSDPLPGISFIPLIASARGHVPILLSSFSPSIPEKVNSDPAQFDYIRVLYMAPVYKKVVDNELRITSVKLRIKGERQMAKG